MGRNVTLFSVTEAAQALSEPWLGGMMGNAISALTRSFPKSVKIFQKQPLQFHVVGSARLLQGSVSQGVRDTRPLFPSKSRTLHGRGRLLPPVFLLQKGDPSPKPSSFCFPTPQKFPQAKSPLTTATC